MSVMMIDLGRGPGRVAKGATRPGKAAPRGSAAAADAVSRKTPSYSNGGRRVRRPVATRRKGPPGCARPSVVAPVARLKLRRKLKAWALRSAFSVASRVPYRAVGGGLPSGAGVCGSSIARGRRPHVAGCGKGHAARGAGLAPRRHGGGILRLGCCCESIARCRLGHAASSQLTSRDEDLEGGSAPPRPPCSPDASPLTNASDVSGRRQAHELAKYEKEARGPRSPRPRIGEGRGATSGPSRNVQRNSGSATPSSSRRPRTGTRS